MSQSNSTEETIFEAARQLAEPDKQAAYLDLACGQDRALRQRIEQLLRAGQRAKDFFQKQGAALPLHLPQAVPAASVNEGPGSIIGRYKLLQQIGEGGCGVVYMAEQEQPVRRRIALKVIKLGMDTKQVIARFEAERQVLALMDHPNIAKIFDAGVTDAPLTPSLSPSDGERAEPSPGGSPLPSDRRGIRREGLSAGRPYFVMELVRGVKITQYCDENNLSTQDRLKLFCQVCQAVQHAHQKGIIHRDIKPSNILVADHDGVPVPKIIDFGIAKATTDQRLTDKTLFTAFEQFVGTPAYMSPEQAKLSGLDIDTRTDIYSLGVLLYELLTGRTPFDQKELLAAGLDEMRRTIREKEPLRPSTRLTQELVAADLRRLKSSGSATEEEIRASSRRLLHLKELVHLLRGDVDWIVMKALEKERARRYETANGLAMDVERYLADEPVVARPPSRAYRFQKLVRRNKLVFAAAAAVLATLLIGFGVSTYLFLKERNTKRALQVEATKRNQAYEFLQEMLKSAGPEKARGRDTAMMLGILEDAEKQMSEGLGGQPELQALLGSTIAVTYDALGNYHKAEALIREALRLQRSVAAEDDPDVTTLLDQLGLTLFHAKDLVGAFDALREALARMQKLPRPSPRSMAQSLNNFALVLWARGDLPGAQATFEQSLAWLRKYPSDDELKADMTSVLGNLGLVQWERNDLVAAEASLTQTVALLKQIKGAEDSPQVQTRFNNLALVMRDRGDLAGAEAMLRKALAVLTNANVNPDVQDFYALRFNLAMTLRYRAARSGDVALFREALQMNPTDLRTAAALACALCEPSLTPLSPGPPAAPSPWRYTASPPPANWASPDFVDAAWQTSPPATGARAGLHRSEKSTVTLSDVWLRREFTLTEVPAGQLAFRVNRNQDARIFLNGVQAAPAQDWFDSPVLIPCSENGRAALKPGRNVLALHCQEADGGTPIDVGLYSSPDPSLGKNQVLAEFDQAIAAAPQRAELYACRANILARLGRWNEAATNLTRATELKTNSYTSWYQLAPLLVEAGDLAGYQRCRRAALKGFGRSDGPNVAERVARLALLVPPEGTELETALALADFAGTAGYADVNLAWRQFVKGLAEYRRGRFDRAVEWLNKALVGGARPDLPGWARERERNRAAAAWFILAMAHQRAQQTAEARDALGKGVEIVQTQFASAQGGDPGSEWPDWLMAGIFMREAREVVEGK